MESSTPELSFIDSRPLQNGWKYNHRTNEEKHKQSFKIIEILDGLEISQSKASLEKQNEQLSITTTKTFHEKKLSCVKLKNRFLTVQDVKL